MILRNSWSRLDQLASNFKAVAVTGARQTGKTTLVKSKFPQKPYVSLENPDTRDFALNDPRGFLNQFPQGAVLDEVQRVPQLFSYLQERLDNSVEKGQFVLSGSNNFLLHQSISQTLAGRIGYLNLPTFSLAELQSAGFLPESDDQLMLKGFYPPVYDQEIPVQDWVANYIRTYVERDVRQIKAITDLLLFERFIRLLAGRCGQELNSSALSVEAGVDVKTIQSWLSVLESSFLIYFLRPYYKNFNKIITKRPKVYFCDTALVCWLLRIQNEDQLSLHPMRGAIFENMVVMELAKIRANKGEEIDLYYWRDKRGYEIDVVLDEGNTLVPIELKSGKTIQNEYFKNLIYFGELSGATNAQLLYGGEQSQKRSNGIQILPWREAILAP